MEWQTQHDTLIAALGRLHKRLSDLKTQHEARIASSDAFATALQGGIRRDWDYDWSFKGVLCADPSGGPAALHEYLTRSVPAEELREAERQFDANKAYTQLCTPGNDAADIARELSQVIKTTRKRAHKRVLDSLGSIAEDESVDAGMREDAKRIRTAVNKIDVEQ